MGYLLTRLRQLGWSENRSLLAQALLRGCYHLYQGLGGFVGNIVMGLVFGRVWQRTNRLWMLVGGHALIDLRPSEQGLEDLFFQLTDAS